MRDRSGHANGTGRVNVGRIDAERRIQRVGHGFENAEEHQSDTDSSGKQHCQPAGITVARFCIRTAETHFAEARIGDAQAEQDEDVGGDDEEPVKC